MKTYYVIKFYPNEYNGMYGYISTSFKDCEDRIMNFHDLSLPNGTCSIIKINENFEELKVYSYVNGKLDRINDLP